MKENNSYDMSESLADSIEKDVHSFVKDTRNCGLPTPPKPGEIMYCQYCGKPMLPQHFSKNKVIRKREFKWQIHNECFMEMDKMADLKTHGLIAERKYIERLNKR